MFDLEIEKDSIAESEQHCYYHQLHLKQHQKIAFRNSIQDWGHDPLQGRSLGTDQSQNEDQEARKHSKEEAKVRHKKPAAGHRVRESKKEKEREWKDKSTMSDSHEEEKDECLPLLRQQ